MRHDGEGIGVALLCIFDTKFELLVARQLLVLHMTEPMRFVNSAAYYTGEQQVISDNG